jgi:hypothetical protein
MTDKEKDLQAEAIDYLRKRIAELEMTVGTLRTFSNEQATCIERLEAQIEKMKRCFNCKYRNKFVESKCGECEDYSKWEIQEND